MRAFDWLRALILFLLDQLAIRITAELCTCSTRSRRVSPPAAREQLLTPPSDTVTTNPHQITSKSHFGTGVKSIRQKSAGNRGLLETRDWGLTEVWYRELSLALFADQLNAASSRLS